MALYKNLYLGAVCVSLLACSGQDMSLEKDAPRANAATDVTVQAVDTTMSLRQASTQTEALKIADNVYMAEGFGNTFLVTTTEGNVIIDTSLASNAKGHKTLLDKVDDRAPEYIIITHAHGDHIGGVDEWKADKTQVIQQSHAEEFLHYQERLKGFFQRRNAAQFGFDLAEFEAVDAVADNYGANIPADILFDKTHNFSMGNLTFEVIAMPSETYDALSVWIPERKAVFVGDLYYESFPNIYTLRGTKPRWALDYVTAINSVLELEPEILIPSHGKPVYGSAEIRTVLEQYRDAILYVHDAVVAGMNAGKSVDELAATITLPDALKIREIYGRVDWSVRGIYQGYVGWFDGNQSTMLGVSPNNAYPVLVKNAGGPDALAALATAALDEGRSGEALALADVILSVNPEHIQALRVRQQVLQKHLKTSKNFNSVGWLKAGVVEIDRKMAME